MAEEIIFKVTADTGSSEKNVMKLEESIEGVDKATKQLSKTGTDLTKTFEEANNGLAPMTSRLGEMEDRMHQLTLEGKAQTQEFIDLQAEVVRYKQAIIETDRAVDVLTEQGRGLGGALQIGTAAAAGYGALEGSMVALGVESEGLTQSFVKLQAIQTVLASLEQLKLSLDKQSLIVTKGRAIVTGVMSAAQTAWTMATVGTTVATQALGAAMLAIPIIAIIAAIVALVAAVASLFAGTEEAKEMNESITESYERLSEAMDRNNEKVSRNADNAIRLAKAQGKSREEIHRLELDKIEKEETARRKSALLEFENIASRKNAYNKALEEGNEDLAREIKEEIQQHRSKYRDLRNLDGQYLADRKILQTEFDKETNEQKQQQEDEAKETAKRNWEKEKARREKEAQLKLDLARKTEDLMVAAIEDTTIRTIETLRVRHERERKELIEKFGKDSALLQQLTSKQNKDVADMNKKFADEAKQKRDKDEAEELADAKKAQDAKNRDAVARKQLEIMQAKQDFDIRMELLKEQAILERDIALQNEKLTEGERLKIKEEAKQKIDALNKESADRAVELERMQTEAMRDIVTSGLQSIDNLASAIFDNRIAKAEEGSKRELELQKRAFKVNKAFQLGQATIQGVQAVQNAYTTALASPITKVFPAYPFIQAGVAGANSLANILKIKAMTFNGGGGGSVSGPQTQPPSVGGGVDAGAGDEGVSTLTGGLPGSGGDTGTGTAKVVIVDSDIKASQENLQQIQTISSIGG